LRIALAPAGAGQLPRFDHLGNLAALAADPPRWPARTDAVSLLSLDIEILRPGLASALPPKRRRLEFLDYPGEWLLDLPLLNQDFAKWSATTLQRLRGAPEAAPFLAFVEALPEKTAGDEAIAESGHRLYAETLVRLRDTGLRYLQPGRFLMPPPGPRRPWLSFFPLVSGGGLGALLAARYDAYCDAVRADLVSPLFGRLDRLVVLADLLSALHDGPEAYADTAAALSAAADALRWQGGWLARVPLLRDLDLSFLNLPFDLPFLGGIRRVAFAATKADHVADRQRGNLAALIGQLTRPPERAAATTSAFAIAAIRCTEDFVWTLEGRPVSAVRGRVAGQGLVGSYPGEVPDRPPGPEFWAHPFLAIPDFQPMRLPLGGRGGVPHIGLDRLLAYLLEDIL